MKYQVSKTKQKQNAAGKPQDTGEPCIICGGPMNDPYGHNARPVAEGQCCAICNDRVVIPTRIADILRRNGKTEEEIMEQLKMKFQ